MFLVGFRVQQNVTSGYIFSNVSTLIGVLISENRLYNKNTNGRNLKNWTCDG